MSLFEFKEDRVVVSRELSLLKPFQDILEREDADILFAYIYHRYDWTSPYATFSQEERETKLRNDLFDGQEPPMDILQPAIDYYVDLNSTDTIKLLESARKAVRELREYFENVIIVGSDKEGAEAKNLMSNLKDVGSIIKSLKQWEEEVRKEKNTSNIRKGVEINEFNSG